VGETGKGRESAAAGTPQAEREGLYSLRYEIRNLLQVGQLSVGHRALL
jgi:hypothetical protein